MALSFVWSWMCMCKRQHFSVAPVNLELYFLASVGIIDVGHHPELITRF